MAQVDPSRARKPLTELPEGTEYYTEGNVRYGYTGRVLYIWSSLSKQWSVYSRHQAERHWNIIRKKV
jgi:hypothetical protein